MCVCACTVCMYCVHACIYKMFLCVVYLCSVKVVLGEREQQIGYFLAEA